MKADLDIYRAVTRLPLKPIISYHQLAFREAQIEQLETKHSRHGIRDTDFLEHGFLEHGFLEHGS